MSDNNIPPFEIQIEIIKRAPVKSIVRFRSVSKTWKSLIDSSEFISGYRARKTQPRSLLLRYTYVMDPIKYEKYVSVNSDTFTQQQDLNPNVSALMKPISGLRTQQLGVIGYSRGLLCFYSHKKGGMLVLWNPSIRRSVGIICNAYQFDIFGFAVCPVTNEPTIVRISEPWKWKVEVFTLTSKKWTVIQCNTKPSLLYERKQVVIDSCIYRVAYEKICLQNGSFTKQYMIVSFDLNTKELKAIDLPDAITNPLRIDFILSKLKGSLVVIVPHRVIREIKVWKTEPDCSFTQLFTINTSCITNIVGFRKNGEVVVETQETPHTDSTLKLYDPCSKQITDLGMSGGSGSFFISSYKSLITQILASILKSINHVDDGRIAKCGFTKGYVFSSGRSHVWVLKIL